MSTKSNINKKTEENKSTRKPLPQSDISEKRKEIFDLSLKKKKTIN